MNLPSACSKDDSSAPIYMWNYSQLSLTWTSHLPFQIKHLKSSPLKKKKFKDMKKDLCQETCNLDGNTGHE